jgi:hypothetical protein
MNEFILTGFNIRGQKVFEVTVRNVWPTSLPNWIRDVSAHHPTVVRVVVDIALP